MWRLRRLTRWEATLYDDPALTDEDRHTKMARVLRHDAALRRHIDRALKALAETSTNCQNEPAPASTPAPPDPPAYPNNRDAGGPCDRGTREQVGGLPAIRAGAPRNAQKLKLRQKCQNEPGIMAQHG